MADASGGKRDDEKGEGRAGDMYRWDQIKKLYCLPIAKKHTAGVREKSTNWYWRSCIRYIETVYNRICVIWKPGFGTIKQNLGEIWDWICTRNAAGCWKYEGLTNWAEIWLTQRWHNEKEHWKPLFMLNASGWFTDVFTKTKYCLKNKRLRYWLRAICVESNYA